MTVVLITSPSGKRAAVRERFRALGWEVREAHLVGASEAEVSAEVQGVDGILAHTEAYSRAALEAADRLRVIARAGVGYDAIDVEAATEKGVLVCTSIGSNDKTVADFALLLMLALARRLVPNHVNVAEHGRFERVVGTDFFGKTVGVIGTGAIGKQVAKRARAFECRLLAYDVVQDHAFAAEHGLEYVPLERLLRESDFVTVHLPLLPATRHLIGERQLALMKPTACLVNTSRGPLVDQDALYVALKERRIAGAGLDVFRTEPLEPDSPLRSLDNVILTPHVAGVAQESMIRSGDMAAENIIRVLQGQPPLACVNPSVLGPA